MIKMFVWAPKYYEETGYNFTLDLLTILYQLRNSYPKRSGLVGESNHIRPIYFRLGHTHVG